MIENMNNDYGKINYLKDKKIALALTIQFCMLITNYSLKQILNIEDTTTRQFISLIFMITTSMFYIRVLPIVIKRIGHIFIITYLVSFIVFFMSYLIFKVDIKYLIEIVFYYYLICLPNFLYYIALKNKKIFLDMILNTSYFQIILVVLFFIFTKLRLSSFEYDMVYSYQAMIPIILLVYKFLNKFNILDFLLAFMGGLIILLVGARGPLLCIIAFIVTYILCNALIGNKKNKFCLILLFILLFAIIILFNFNYILNLINMIFLERNIYIRTIETLLNIKEIDFSSGRLDIYNICLDSIKNSPLLGVGIGGDRVILDGTYPHNIIIEILMNFGVFFGLILILLILFIIIKSILSRDFVNRSLSIILLGIGFVQLFISGSYLTSPNFWLFLSICLCSTFKFNHNKELN